MWKPANPCYIIMRLSTCDNQDGELYLHNLVFYFPPYSSFQNASTEKNTYTVRSNLLQLLQMLWLELCWRINYDSVALFGRSFFIWSDWFKIRCSEIVLLFPLNIWTQAFAWIQNHYMYIPRSFIHRRALILFLPSVVAPGWITKWSSSCVYAIVYTIERHKRKSWSRNVL